MELRVTGEDLSFVDCGGGYRELCGHVHYDTSLPKIRQEQVVIMETLGLMLAPWPISEEYLNDTADKVQDALRQWRAE